LTRWRIRRSLAFAGLLPAFLATACKSKAPPTEQSQSLGAKAGGGSGSGRPNEEGEGISGYLADLAQVKISFARGGAVASGGAKAIGIEHGELTSLSVYIFQVDSTQLKEATDAKTLPEVLGGNLRGVGAVNADGSFTVEVNFVQAEIIAIVVGGKNGPSAIPLQSTTAGHPRAVFKALAKSGPALPIGDFIQTASSLDFTGTPTPLRQASKIYSPYDLIDWPIAEGSTSPTDWVGLYPAGAADTAFLSWQYLNGTHAPTVQFLSATLTFGPLPPGAYELRRFASNGYGLIDRLSFSVVNAPAKLTLDKESYSPYDFIKVSVSGGSASPTDWVGLYPAGASDTAFMAWQYFNGTRVPTIMSAAETLSFRPLQTGSYEIRAFAANRFTRLAAATFHVDQPPVVLTLAKMTFSSTEVVDLSLVGGTGSATDWVGLYGVGAADSAFIAWQYFNGTRQATAATGQETLAFGPLAPGHYEFRVFANNGFARLGSTSFQIGP